MITREGMKMNLALLVENLYVSNQLKSEEDVKKLAEVGVKYLMCNRPDGEEAHQVGFEQVTAWANAHGIETTHLPVVMNQMNMDDLSQFAQWFAQYEGDVKGVYCRTGTRSSLLWALSQVDLGKVNAIEAITTVAQSGRNISGAAMMLQQLEPHIKEA